VKICAGFWVLSLVTILLLMFGLGAAIRGHWLGILIDERNRISLSRFQIVLWTILIVSAFTAIALQTHQMAIYLPPELWALMAIATGSTAGSAIIKATKAAQQPTPAVLADPNIPAPVNRLGVLFAAPKPKFTDMFRGEELLDANYVDIAKVQMFFFTIAAIVGYTIDLAHYDISGAGAKPPWSKELLDAYSSFFPLISTALVTLIGISHAGYLTVKAAPHTPTT
jgi:hypothetical protein